MATGKIVGCVLLVLTGLVNGEETTQVLTVTGRAVGATPAAAEEAKLDALRVAVAQICGSFINAQSQSEDFQLTYDKVLEQPVGFARVVRIVREPKVLDDEITEVQLQAEVWPAKFEKRWAEFAHIRHREGNPRCVVVVKEDFDVDDAIPPVTEGVVQSELENFFLGKKVQLMDKDSSDAVRRRDLKVAADTGDLQKAVAAGAAFKADVVVLGTAEAKRTDSVVLEGRELKRWNATLTIRVIQTDSAAILASNTYRPAKVFTSGSGGGREALASLAKEAAPDVLSDIAVAWRDRATVGKNIQLTIENCPRPLFKAIQAEAIKSKGITGGAAGFKLRELLNNLAQVDVSWKYELDQLADRLEELRLPDNPNLRLVVVEQSANRIHVRVAMAPRNAEEQVVAIKAVPPEQIPAASAPATQGSE